MFTKSAIIKQLKSMGIREDDTITIHTSLRAIGEVEGRAEGLIEALREIVASGLLLIPSHTYRNIREVPVYDVRTTMPCIGTLPCIAVQLANTAYDNGDTTCRRSLHPCHSVVAIGQDALSYIEDDRYTTTPCPLTGSYGKLIPRHGKILLAGVGLERNTFMHGIFQATSTEEHAPYPVLVRGYDGTETSRFTSDSWGYSGNFCQYQDILTEKGILTFGKLGNADLIVCDAEACFHTVSACINRK